MFEEAEEGVFELGSSVRAEVLGDVKEDCIYVVKRGRCQAVLAHGLAAGSALSEDLTGLFRGVGLAVAALLEAEFEALVDGFAILVQPVFLQIEKAQGAGNNLGGRGEVAAFEFALDDLFAGGIESEIHGKSIDRSWLGRVFYDTVTGALKALRSLIVTGG